MVFAHRSRSAAFAALLLTCGPLGLAMASCRGSSSATDGDGGSVDVSSFEDASLFDWHDDTYYPAASCLVAIDSPPLLPPIHVPIGTVIEWNSNPPSSGPHFPIWAAYQAYTTPVPRGYYLHNEEHGAIVLLYNCALAAPGGLDCDTIQSQLQQVSDALPDDPFCLDHDAGLRVRTVITPDPLLDVPVAAAAWGWTYKAQCFDLQTLVAFARAHYAQGREDFCNNGQSTF